MKYVFCCLLLLGSMSMRGQSQNSGQRKNLSYYLAPIKWKSVPKSAKLDLQFDTRNSFIKDYPINVYGINVGVIFRQRFRAGGGFYWINQNFTDNVYGLSPTSGKFLSVNDVPLTLPQLTALHYKPGVDFEVAYQQLDLYFGSVGIAYTFYSSRLFDLVIPIELGYGTFRERLYDPSGDNFSTISAPIPKPTKGYFFPGQIGFETITKVHRWAYLETVIGYRGTLYQRYTSGSLHTAIDSQFNGLYYIIGVKVQIGTIFKEYKEYRKRKKQQ